MSTTAPDAARDTTHVAAQHASDRHGEDEGHAHGTRKSYLIGFALSAVLTAIPFALVMTGTLSNQVTAFVIMGFAVAQIIVHMIFFLHMNTRSEEGWNMMALIFTVVIVVIALSGSLWVMYHMNANMMPMSAHDISQMP
jgi:cytochrome o ubiquinol oxidase operon protein cyoD